MSTLDARDFDLLSDLLKSRSGLVVTRDKVYLLESRLTPIARRRGHNSLPELVGELRMHANEALLSEVTEAMTTNESFFYRDQTPFDILTKHTLPALRAARSSAKRLRIWCAAASTGQEPYSIAMLFADNPGLWADWQIDIVGTDLSTNALNRAKSGIYSQFEVQRGLPIQKLIKYFEQKGDTWQLNEPIRKMVRYGSFNLLDSMASLGQFDIVFCRNVLIYFDAPTKGKVLDAIRGQLTTDGAMFLGAAETVLGLTKAFRPVHELRGLYVPTESLFAVAA